MKAKKPTKAQIRKLYPRVPFVFLLNGERVLSEIAELAKLHIAKLLDVDPRQVTARLELERGKVIPTFDVDMPQAGALERQYIQSAIVEVWLGWAKRELVDRLSGLGDARSYGEDQANSCSEEEAGEESPAES